MNERAADLLAAVDWDRHPLGPRASWPATLEVVVASLIGSPESMYLVWGPERTFFFNDPYTPILGPRLAGAMGARLEELWADAWPSIEPIFLNAEAGEASRIVDMFIPMARFGEPEETWWTFSYTPVREASGEVVGVLCITNETTDKVLSEQARAAAVAQQELLNRELSHRVKNTITMVQALATQSLKRVQDREAVRTFEDRLVALGQAHNILLQHSWQPASIRAVLASVLEVHADRDRFTVDGPDVMLASAATLSLSLLLHELATNAVKYGALSAETGRVDIRWDVAPPDGDGGFHLHWRETGGPPVAPPSASGFGSRLIGMGLCGSRDVSLRFEPTGLQADFSLPLDRLSEE